MKTSHNIRLLSSSFSFKPSFSLKNVFYQTIENHTHKIIYIEPQSENLFRHTVGLYMLLMLHASRLSVHRCTLAAQVVSVCFCDHSLERALVQASLHGGHTRLLGRIILLHARHLHGFVAHIPRGKYRWIP